MKRLILSHKLVPSIVALAASLAGPWIASAPAQETPEMQLDFVRKLRAKGYFDLTSEYIDKLSKAEPALAGQLSLESARSLVALAREKSLDQRGPLFNQAHDRFQEFVKKYEGKPEAVQARLEMAKLDTYFGQAVLTKALRDHEEPKDQHEAARKAEQIFLKAGQELDVLIKQLTGKEQVQAKLDRAVNLMDQARTYIETEKTDILRKRGEIMLEAKKIFAGLAAEDNSDAALLAHAWLIKANYGLDDPLQADKHYKKVLGSKEGPPYAAQRLARYFYIAGIRGDVTIKVNKIKLIEDEANKWLKEYSNALKTWEGQGVRYELANAYLEEAATFKDQKSLAVAKLMGQAEKIYSSLADLDGDFSEEAKRRTIYIAVTKLEKTKREDIRDFENSLLKGYYEKHKAVEASRKADDEKALPKKKQLEAAKAEHMKEAVRSVQQALSQTTSSTPLSKLDEARFFQIQLYFMTNDLFRAAVAGEALGRTRPPTKSAPRGIGAAFTAYDMIGEDEQIRQRIRDLAEYVLMPDSQKFWKNEPITSVSHHHLAMMFNKDKDFKQAIAHLEKISPDFAGYLYSQSQLVFVRLGAALDKNNKLSDQERDQLREQARAVIKKMPMTLPADTDPTTATLYLHAQMEEAKFLYKDAAGELKDGKLKDASDKYTAMAKFVGAHQDAFKKSTIKFEDKRKEELGTMMTVLEKYAKLGLADVEFRLGNYDKVLSFDLVGPLIQKISDLAKKPGKIRVKDNVVVGEILTLGLRTYVQKGVQDKAQELFDWIERLAPEDDAAAQGDTSNLMFSLIGDIEQQVKAQKDATKKKELIENYSKFIDSIAKALLEKRSRPQDYMFLANAYATLEQPQKAAELYEKIPVPKQVKDVDEELKRRADAKKLPIPDAELEKLKAKLIEEEYVKRPELKMKEYQEDPGMTADQKSELKDKLAELKTKTAGDVLKERQEYWYLQIQYGKSLRESKSYEKAFGVLNRIINHPLGEYLILAEIEKNFVLEDSDRIGASIKGWSALMNRLRERVSDNAIKKLYFDCYFYNARCWYKYSQSAMVQKKGTEEQYLNNAAKYIVNLENARSKEGWDQIGGRFHELMAAEPKLRKTYDKLKIQSGSN